MSNLMILRVPSQVRAFAVALAEPVPIFVRMDIEGSEYELLLDLVYYCTLLLYHYTMLLLDVIKVAPILSTALLYYHSTIRMDIEGSEYGWAPASPSYAALEPTIFSFSTTRHLSVRVPPDQTRAPFHQTRACSDQPRTPSTRSALASRGASPTPSRSGSSGTVS
jgi:hypothetical protein